MNANYKYMGKYELDYLTGYNCTDVIVPEGEPVTDSNYYELSECYRVKDSVFDGIIHMCNTSAIGVKISDCGERFKLWKIS